MNGIALNEDNSHSTVFQPEQYAYQLCQPGVESDLAWLGARVASHPQMTLGLGMDAVTWAREGLTAYWPVS